MDGAALTMVVIGGLLLLGLAAEWARAWLPIPRVSALILLGVLVGPAGFDLLPSAREQWFPVSSAIALVMVGFLIGGEFTAERVRAMGREAGAVALLQSLAAALAVGGGLAVLGADLRVALPLGGIAAATAPAAIIGVLQDVGRNHRFSRLLLVVAALADAISLVLFSVLVVVSGVLQGAGGAGGAVGTATWELGGAVVLGVVLGLPAALLTGRLQPGRPILEEAVGLVLLCAGAALWLDVSYLLAAVVMGIVVANVGRHHERAFSEIEGIEWPFLVLFFVLAGASLELGALAGMGLTAVGYVVLRAAGKVAGAWAGTALSGAQGIPGRWVGTALLPQAGVALGLALLAEEQLPDVGQDVVAVVVATTVLFELVGPPLTRLAVQRATGRDPGPPEPTDHRPR